MSLASIVRRLRESLRRSISVDDVLSTLDSMTLDTSTIAIFRRLGKPLVGVYVAPIGAGKTVGVLRRATYISRRRPVIISSSYHYALIEPLAKFVQIFGTVPRVMYIAGRERFCRWASGRELILRGVPSGIVCSLCPYRDVVRQVSQQGVFTKRFVEQVRKQVFSKIREIIAKNRIIAPSFVTEKLAEYGVRVAEIDITLRIRGIDVHICPEYVYRQIRFWRNRIVLTTHAEILSSPNSVLGRAMKVSEIFGTPPPIWVVDEYDVLLYQPIQLPRIERPDKVVELARSMGFPEVAEWFEKTYSRIRPYLDLENVVKQMDVVVLRMPKRGFDDPPPTLLTFVSKCIEERRFECLDVVKLRWIVEMCKNGMNILLWRSDGGLAISSFDPVVRTIFGLYPEIPRVMTSATPVNPRLIYEFVTEKEESHLLIAPETLTTCSENVVMSESVSKAVERIELVTTLQYRPPTLTMTTYKSVLERDIIFTLLGLGFIFWAKSLIVLMDREALDKAYREYEAKYREAVEKDDPMQIYYRKILDILSRRIRLSRGASIAEGVTFPSSITVTRDIERFTDAIMVGSELMEMKVRKDVVYHVMDLDKVLGVIEIVTKYGAGLAMNGMGVMVISPNTRIALSISYILRAMGFGDVVEGGIDVGNVTALNDFVKIAKSILPAEIDDESLRTFLSKLSENRGYILLENNVMVTFLRSAFTRGQSPPFMVDYAIVLGTGYRCPALFSKELPSRECSTPAKEVVRGGYIVHSRIDIVEATSALVQTIGRAMRRESRVCIAVPMEFVKVFQYAPQWFKKLVVVIPYMSSKSVKYLERSVIEWIREEVGEPVYVSYGTTRRLFA